MLKRLFNTNTQGKVYYVKYLPIMNGIIIPHIEIFIRKSCKNNIQLHKHEQVHWKQYKRMGSLLFLFRYIFQFIFIGYDTMPLELEARQFDSSLWDYRKRNWKKY